MLIDWRTVAAQFINFLLLVLLLSRYFFKPTLALMKERNEKIRKELEEAARLQESSRQERGAVAEEQKEFATKKSSLFKTAIIEARQEKDRLLRGAQEEYGVLRTKLHAHAEEDKRRVFSELKESIETEAFALAKTALENLSSASLEEQMVEKFAAAIGQMTHEDRKRLLFDLSHSSYAITFRTAYELPERLRLVLEKVVRGLFDHQLACTFEKDASLISGVEMLTSGHTVGWSLFSSLLSIREAV